MTDMIETRLMTLQKAAEAVEASGSASALNRVELKEIARMVSAVGFENLDIDNRRSDEHSIFVKDRASLIQSIEAAGGDPDKAVNLPAE